MSRFNQSVSAMLLFGVVGASGVAVAAEPLSAGDCFVAAFKANDPEGVAACYVEDGIIWFPSGSMAQGREAIRDGFAHYFGEFEVKDVSLTQIGETGTDDTRTAWGTYTIISVHKATQKEMVENGRFVDVQKLVDGKWLYVVDHPSGDPQAAE